MRLFITITLFAVLLLLLATRSTSATKHSNNSTSRAEYPVVGSKCNPGVHGMCAMMTKELAASGKCDLKHENLCELIKGNVKECKGLDKYAYLKCDPKTNKYKAGDCRSQGSKHICYTFTPTDGQSGQAHVCAEPDTSNVCQPKNASKLEKELMKKYFSKDRDNRGKNNSKN